MGIIEAPEITRIPKEFLHMNGLPVIDTAKFYNIMADEIIKKHEEYKVKTNGQILYYNNDDYYVSINMEEIVYYIGNNNHITIYMTNGKEISIYDYNVTNLKDVRGIIDNYFENKSKRNNKNN
jgi:hypothetical protein